MQVFTAKEKSSLSDEDIIMTLHVGKIDRLFRANILVHHGCRV